MTSQFMPEEYEGKFKMNEWNSLTVSNICTGPNGYHWVKLYADQACTAPSQGKPKRPRFPILAFRNTRAEQD
jgi:hypothetical protein